MTKRLILIDSTPNGGMKTIRHAVEEFLDGTTSTTAFSEKKEGWVYFDAIKPALLGRSHVILEGSWYPHSHHLEGAELQMLERAALTCGVVHIVCRPSRYTGDREQIDIMDALLADDYTRVEYDSNSNLHSQPVDFVRRSVLPVMDASPIAPAPYIGKYAPRAIVLVADKPSFKGFAPPFISFRENGVSWWLADGMRRAGLMEEYFLWVNCRDADEVETDPTPLIGEEVNGRRLGGLRPQQVFALGDQAAKWCSGYGIPFTQHKHPLSWKRFNAGKPYPLIKDLVNAVGVMK